MRALEGLGIGFVHLPTLVVAPQALRVEASFECIFPV
jgi:hypothetical protein